MSAASAVFLIRPRSFGFNAETAATNSFQNDSQQDVRRQALEEFDAFAGALTEAGINVQIFEDTADPPKPDAIFPNNWISTHADGSLIIYPMFAPNRRIEKRYDIVEKLKEQYAVSAVLDLSAHEQENVFLEGTGSIVFDHWSKLAYAAISPRTNKRLFEQLAAHLGYQPVSFDTADEKGKPVYHTNVLLCIARRFAVICADCIPDTEERAFLMKSLSANDRRLIEISREQMSCFAGNMLALNNNKGEEILVLSRTAYDSLREEQKATLAALTHLLPLSVPTIEKVGGGSVRCMMAELFVPKKN